MKKTPSRAIVGVVVHVAHRLRRRFPVVLLVALLPLVSAVSLAQETKRDIQYKMTPDGPLCLDLYYPASKPSGKYPVAIYSHGGGWAAGSKKGATHGNMGKVVQGLTGKGFCVASVDYRLCKKGGHIAMRDCVIDSKDAIRYLSKNSDELSLDTSRVFTFGDSAGGQIAQMLLLAPPEALPGDEALAKYGYKTIAGVSWYGPCDFERTDLFNYNDRPDFRDRFGPRILGPDSDPKDKLALYREVSPINYLKKDSPPLLMIQGDGDTTIPVKHAYYVQAKAKELGAPVEIMIIKHAGHNWRKADGSTPIDPSADVIVNRTVDFIADHLSQTPPIHASSRGNTP